MKWQDEMKSMIEGCLGYVLSRDITFTIYNEAYNNVWKMKTDIDCISFTSETIIDLPSHWKTFARDIIIEHAIKLKIEQYLKIREK